MVLDEALEERIAEILQAAGETLAEPRYGRDQAEQPQAGGDPGGRDDAGAGGHRAGAGGAPSWSR